MVKFLWSGQILPSKHAPILTCDNEVWLHMKKESLASSIFFKICNVPMAHKSILVRILTKLLIHASLEMCYFCALFHNIHFCLYKIDQSERELLSMVLNII